MDEIPEDASKQRAHYIECDCHTAYHFLRIEPDEDIPGMLNVAFVSTGGSFWHRVRWAAHHIFRGGDLVSADVIVSRERVAASIRGEG